MTFRDYSGVGVSADAATQIRLAEDKKNLEREIAFAREVNRCTALKELLFPALSREHRENPWLHLTGW